MLTDQDIQKLSSTFATKEEMRVIVQDGMKDTEGRLQAQIETVRDEAKDTEGRLQAQIETVKDDVREVKKDVDGLRESIQILTTSIDGLVKRIEDLYMEYAAVSSQLSRHEKWIKEIAEKTGVNLSTE